MTDNDDNFIPAGRKRPSDATRARLLEAGRQMILERGLSSTLPVRVADVAASVGHTTGAAYQLWRSQAEFQRALSEHLLSISNWSNFQSDTEAMVAAVTAGAEATEIIRTAGNAFFERLVGRPEFYVYLHFWSVGYHDPNLHAAMKRGYDEFRQQLTTVYSAMLGHLGLRMAAPFTIDHMATTPSPRWPRGWRCAIWSTPPRPVRSSSSKMAPARSTDGRCSPAPLKPWSTRTPNLLDAALAQGPLDHHLMTG